MDYSVGAARTPAQKRLAIQLSNAGGTVRRCLGYYCPARETIGGTADIVQRGNDERLVQAIKDALSIVRVTRVDVRVTLCDGRRMISIYCHNVDQIDKSRAAMAALGFASPHHTKYVLDDYMHSLGFTL